MRDTPFPSSSEGTRPYYENQQLKRSELVFEKKKKKKRSKHVTAGAGKTKRFSIGKLIDICSLFLQTFIDFLTTFFLTKCGLHF